MPVLWLQSLGSSIDDYAKAGGPGEVWLLCSFYHDTLRPLQELQGSYEANIHRLVPNGITWCLSLIWNLWELR